MDESTPVAAPAAFKDRRAGLIVFGIVLILIGCACVLLVAMMFALNSLMQIDRPGAPPRTAAIPGGQRAMFATVILYGEVAAIFIWLGIGSIMARRWARALTLILAWLWLLTGVLSVAGMAVFLPGLLATATPPGGAAVPDSALTTIFIASLGCVGVVLVLLPVLFVLFYRSRHVKATCEARDPVVRWTDRCPLPVLGLSVAMGVGTLFTPVMLAQGHTVIPCFGTLVSGAPATIVLLIAAAVSAYAAWASAKVKPAGWWTAIGFFLATTVSGLITLWRVDLVEWYRLSGTPDQQVAQIQQLGLLTRGNMMLWTAAAGVLMLGYLLSVRKHFRQAP